jgi:hypothetical protein
MLFYTPSIVSAGALAIGRRASEGGGGVIRARGLSKRFGRPAALEAVDLNVAFGELLVLLRMSANGADTDNAL